MTLPFDMEVYTKRLLRSNSHNVGEPRAGKAIQQVVDQSKFNRILTCQQRLPNHPFVPVLNPAWTKHPRPPLSRPSNTQSVQHTGITQRHYSGVVSTGNKLPGPIYHHHISAW